MPNLKFLFRLGILYILIIGMGVNMGWSQEQEIVSGGERLYQKFCASCHGIQGKGNGHRAESLQAKPADLTKLSANHGGTFPFWEVYRTIDGRRAVADHGTRKMPVFGHWFRIPDDEVSIETEWADQVRGRIWQLLLYLKSIQAP
jgi:mono/diheme cytochrome c family protein